MRTQRKIRKMTMSDQQETQRAFWRQVILFQKTLHRNHAAMKHAQMKTITKETDANSALSAVRGEAPSWESVSQGDAFGG